MTEQFQAYQSKKTGLIGDLETLAVRMEWAGMTKEVAEDWAKTVRKAIQHLEAQSEWIAVVVNSYHHVMEYGLTQNGVGLITNLPEAPESTTESA